MDMDYLTVTEVSEMTRIPAGTLRWWRHRNEGPFSFRMGRHIFYRRSDVEAWIEKQREITGTKAAG